MQEIPSEPNKTIPPQKESQAKTDVQRVVETRKVNANSPNFTEKESTSSKNPKEYLNRKKERSERRLSNNSEDNSVIDKDRLSLGKRK